MIPELRLIIGVLSMVYFMDVNSRPSLASSIAAHVVYASSNDHAPGLKASAKSVVMSSATPSRIAIHIFELESSRIDLDELEEWVLMRNSTMERRLYSYEEVAPFINVNLNNTSRLKNPSNYVRYMLADILPNVSKCLYLDSDTIVTKDVVPFMNERTTNKVLSAFPRDVQTVSLSAFKILKDLGIDVAQSNPSFNAGIVVFNLEAWRKENITGKARLVSKYNEEYKLWSSYGSQPALLVLLGGDRFEQLSGDLFVNSIGYRQMNTRNLNPQQVEQAMFLHWNGNRKPWNPCTGKKNCFNFDIWHRYNSMS